jgi:dGTPase
MVTKLGLHSPWDDDNSAPKYSGLDLTRATLNALLKYPWRRGENGPKSQKKWGVYASEADDFNFARALSPVANKRSLEAELMDWADDVTYSVHDMEDFYRAGLIPLDRLRIDDRAKQSFYDRAFARGDSEPATLVSEHRFTRAQLEQSFETILKTMPVEEPYSGSREQRCHLRNLTSGLIGLHLRAVAVKKCTDSKPSLVIDPERKCQVVMGKELTWQFVILNPSLGAQQQGHRTIIRGLFEIFHCEAKQNRFNAFPSSARETLQAAETDDNRDRAIVDLIATMTEQQAIQMFQRLAGISLGSVLLNIVR